MLKAAHIRDGFGFLTIEETAERYGIDPQRIADAVQAEELGSMALMYEEDAELVLLPTKDAP